MNERKEYNESIENLFIKYNSSLEGLDKKKIIKNKKKYGENILKEKKRKNKAQVFLEQYKNLLVILLIIAAIISVFTGGIENTCVILFVITLNAVIGTIQYSKAEKSINGLKKLTKSSQKVIRENSELIIDEKDIVVGDIVIFNAGDIITCDTRLIEVNDFEVDESSLTGESEGIYKTSDDLNGDLSIHERKNIAYKGSRVINGKAKGICIKVGMNTEIGKIASLIDNTEENKSPLEISVDNFSKHLSLIIVIICGIVFLVGVYNHVKVLDSLMFAIALAVAAIPEALFTILTIVLAIGTEKMAKENAVVKDLKVVETLGCVDCICTDKTGTLTENKMTVYSTSTNEEELFNLCLILCNDASVVDLNSDIIKTDTAILRYMIDKGNNIINIRENHKKVYEIPFNSKRKIMSTVNIVNGKKYLFTKGAFEIIIEKCNKININNIERYIKIEDINQIKEEFKSLTSKGLRVLGCCYKDISLVNSIDEKIEDNYVFLGLISLNDPPKKGVNEAIEECNLLNIKPIMITGDYEETAKSIGSMVGIIPSGVLNGSELIDSADIENVNIYSRVSPSDKINIVSKLQEKGKIVAFVGDGVNDAPAIKKANVGISMGKGGTEVAKEASSIILVDDNYQTIVNSIKRGRGIFDNIQNVILYLMSGNIAGLFMVLYTSIADMPVPFAPVHLLFINLINDSLPAIGIGVDDNIGEDDLKPRNSKLKILNKKSSFKMMYQGLLIFVCTLISFLIGYKRDIYVARTMAFATLALARLFHCFNCRGNYSIFRNHKFNKVIYMSLFIGIILVNMLLFIPSLQGIFFVSNLSEYEILAVYFWALIPTIIIQMFLIFKKK